MDRLEGTPSSPSKLLELHDMISDEEDEFFDDYSVVDSDDEKKSDFFRAPTLTVQVFIDLYRQRGILSNFK